MTKARRQTIPTLVVGAALAVALTTPAGAASADPGGTDPATPTPGSPTTSAPTTLDPSTASATATSVAPPGPAAPTATPTVPGPGDPMRPADSPSTTPTAAPTVLPPGIRPAPSARSATGLAVRASVRCVGCVPPFVWSAGTGQVQVIGQVLPGRTGATVSIQRQTAGAATYVPVGTARTDARGTFTWTGAMPPAGSYAWRAVVDEVASPPSRITVGSPGISVTQPAATDTLLNPRVTGVTTPAGSGLRVRSEVLVGGRWAVSQYSSTGANGSYSLPVTYGNGAVMPVTVRTGLMLPGGAMVHSRAITINRLAVMRPTTRRTVAADVPRTYRAGCPVGPSRLTTIDMNHWGFDGRIHRGRLIIRDGNVQPIVRSLQVGFNGRFPIREMRDASVYGGNDVISMEHDNANAFNCRRVVGNPYRMSPHAYGTSIDINPVENPYRIPAGIWLPRNGAAYVKRTPYRPGMLTSSTPLTKALIGNGFRWLSGFDWQHFQR